MDEYGESFEILGYDFDIEDFVVTDERIPVHVLEPGGYVQKRFLETYDLDLPDFRKVMRVWIWHAENGHNMCEKCGARDGAVFFDVADIPEMPVHPNCQCYITQDIVDEDGRTLQSKKYMTKTNEPQEKEAKDMKISDRGIEWLKDKEGCVKQNDKHIIYDDRTKFPILPDGPLPKGATIGYGHLIKPGEDFSKGLTEKQATELLMNDIAKAQRVVQENITPPLSQNQYDALVSLAFNIGAGNFKNSTIVKYINDKNYVSNIYPTQEKAWKAWNRSNGKVSTGLINRRNYEWEMFNNNYYYFY